MVFLSTFEKFSKQLQDEYGKSGIARDAVVKMAQLCAVADWLDEEFGADYIEFAFDRGENVCGIEMSMPDMSIDDCSNSIFFNGITSADFLHFSASKDLDLIVRFGVKGLWLN